MNGRQTGLFRIGLLIWALILTCIAFVGALHFREILVSLSFGQSLPSWVPLPVEPVAAEDLRVHWMLLAGLMPAWAVCLYLAGVTDFRIARRRTVLRYLRGVGLGTGVLVSLVFVFRLDAVPRSFVLLFACSSLLLMVVGHFVVMETIAFIRRKQVDGHRLLVIGRSSAAVGLARALRSQAPWKIKLLGHVEVPGEASHPEAGFTVGRLEDLAILLDSQPVDEVVFASQDLPLAAFDEALNACDERGVDVLLPLPPALPAHSHVEVAHVDGFDAPLLGLRRTPKGEARLALKRLIDLAGVLLAMPLALPLMLAVAIAVKLTSKGPVFFRQVRAGRNGRRFTMLKFRSMVVDAEHRKAQLLHLNELSGPVFKIRKDPRVTKIGSLIRKTSLDELPQLFNILRGDMSLVGPRPPLPSEVEGYEPWQRRRLSVKPGLTGLWQVSGRNDIDFEEWMAMDLRYIDSWSIWLDVKILLKTVPAVLHRSGAS
ncbi:MAG: sugar transferase [Deltaproteobacteria bacterium]|nr:sugar transferase [Deltaproteobacteria bacterium]